MSCIQKRKAVIKLEFFLPNVVSLDSSTTVTPNQKLIIKFPKKSQSCAAAFGSSSRKNYKRLKKVWCRLWLIRTYILLYPNPDIKYSVEPTSGLISRVIQGTETASFMISPIVFQLTVKLF
jgi:hypothetical protein